MQLETVITLSRVLVGEASFEGRGNRLDASRQTLTSSPTRPREPGPSFKKKKRLGLLVADKVHRITAASPAELAGSSSAVPASIDKRGKREAGGKAMRERYSDSASK